MDLLARAICAAWISMLDRYISLHTSAVGWLTTVILLTGVEHLLANLYTAYRSEFEKWKLRKTKKKEWTKNMAGPIDRIYAFFLFIFFFKCKRKKFLE